MLRKPRLGPISPISALGTKIRLAELEGDDKNSPVNSERGKGGVSSEEVKLEIPNKLDIFFLGCRLSTTVRAHRDVNRTMIMKGM